MNASAAAALSSSMNSANVISSDRNSSSSSSSSSSSLLFFKNRPLLSSPASRPCLVSVSLRRNPKEDNIKNNSKRCCLSFTSATRSSTVIESATAVAEGQQDIIKPISETEGAASKSVARRLILLRHAHSTWDNPSLRDHDRPLSKAGKADAAKVSQKLQKLGWIPQLILSSDALRTRQTLKIMQEQVADFLDAEVRFISSFYSIAAMDGQTADHLQQAICRCSRDEISTVMCMGHNRGWEEAASMFTGASIELKTCNAALLEAEGKSWEEAFALAGLGGWKLQGIVKPSNGL